MALLSLKGVKIYIDPGHGGQQNVDIPGSEIGTTGYHGFFVQEDEIYEKDINLSIGLKLRDMLENVNATVRMSRTTDTEVGLYQRAQEANAFGADLFISIHNNAASNQSVSGTMVLYPPRGVIDETKQLAAEMSEDISQKLGTKNLGAIERDDLVVLNETSVPAVLAECVFMTNPAEEELIITDEAQQLAAEGMYNSITNFFLTKGGGVEVAVCPILPVDFPETVIDPTTGTAVTVLPLGGEVNAFVQRLQDALNNYLPPTEQLDTDGIYGPGTANALFSFMQQVGRQGRFPDIALYNETGELLAGCETYNALNLNCDRVFPQQMPGLADFNATYETLVNLQNTNPKVFECRKGLSRNFLIGLGLTGLIVGALIVYRG
jgi:N-acetylmuramoyl-L-alanine amidase